MPTAKRSLNILIVGAGLGGLAAGLALQTDGHKVTIIDSTPEFAEVGNPLASTTSSYPTTNARLAGWGWNSGAS